jgi:predicted aspartyl protease
VQIALGVTLSVAEELQKAGKPVPPLVLGRALIDTGTSDTCIDQEEAERMSLPVIDCVEQGTARHPPVEADVYAAQIQILGAAISITLPIERAVGTALKQHGLLALIGCDVLRRCVFNLNGPTDSFSLSL